MRSDAVVIGGSAAGLTAAISIKTFYPDREVTVIRREKNVLVPCGIPYIFGSLDSVEKNYMPEKPYEALGINRLIDTVLEIDTESHKVRTEGGEEVEYEKLLITTGSVPMRIPVEGLDMDGVFFVKKDAEHMRLLRERVVASKRIVIIGGGFIGVEFADDIVKMGEKEVHIVELLPHCLALAFDDEFCEAAEAELKEEGVVLHTGARVKRIVDGGNGKVRGVEVEGEGELDADMVIVAVGARPNTELAKNAGIETDSRGFIVVDRLMRTSAEDVFAVGDCAQKRCFFTGKEIPALLASVACMEARVASLGLFDAGRTRPNEGPILAFSTKVGNLALGCAGMVEKRAKNEGIDCVVGTSESVDRHPGSLPGAHKVKTKLIFSRVNRVLLGGEVSGGLGAGEMVNVIACAVQNSLRMEELMTMQQATHPLLTSSPIAYTILAATAAAMKTM